MLTKETSQSLVCSVCNPFYPSMGLVKSVYGADCVRCVVKSVGATSGTDMSVEEIRAQVRVESSLSM